MVAANPYAGPNRRLARPSPLVVGLALLGVTSIAFVTLCPIGLRPHVAPANEERAVAYFILGGIIAVAAGRRWMGALAAVMLLAYGLEAAQLLIPTRHATMPDAMVKAFGGALGSAAGQLVFPLRRLALKAWAQRPGVGAGVAGAASVGTP